jgi:hypothetical protein
MSAPTTPTICCSYRLVYDFQHPVLAELKALDYGFKDLTGETALPALDFLRSDLLAETGNWRPTGVMDGSDAPEPVPSTERLLRKAAKWMRTYLTGGPGIHDIHMNQGSQGSYLNDGVDDKNDHNDIWQDGAVLVDFGTPTWAGYLSLEALRKAALPMLKFRVQIGPAAWRDWKLFVEAAPDEAWHHFSLKAITHIANVLG